MPKFFFISKKYCTFANDMMDTGVVIIGAGPAGSTCANLLKKNGVDCVLVDFQQFPREKVCGGGLTPRAWHLLEEMMPDLDYDYLPVTRQRLFVEGKMRCEIEPSEEQRNVSRKDFDYRLLQRYLQSGGTFLQDSFSRFDEQEEGRILVTMRSGRQIGCRYLVAADGANSRVRKQLLRAYHGNFLFLEQKVEKRDDVLDGEFSARYDHGYYYRFPHKGYDVVGYGAKDASREGFRGLLAELGIAETKICGAYIPVEVVRSDRDNIMLIGDAGGFANRVTYEGLYYALATGRSAAHAIIKGRPFSETNRDLFRRKRREKWMAGLFYSRVGLWLVIAFSRNRHLVKWIYDNVVVT